MGYEVRHQKLKGHRFQQQKRDEMGPPPLGYPPPSQQQLVTAVPYYSMAPTTVPQQLPELQQARADVKRHGRNELVGEVGAAAAGAFALYELHEADVDPAHARRHKMEATLAGAVAVGSANYAYHEHKEKKKSEQLVEMLSGGVRNNPLAPNHFMNPKKEKQSFLHILSGDSQNHPPSRDQKKKQHHHLW